MSTKPDLKKKNEEIKAYKNDPLNYSFNDSTRALSLVFETETLVLAWKRTMKTMVFCTEHVNIGENLRQIFESNSLSPDYLRKTRICRHNWGNS